MNWRFDKTVFFTFFFCFLSLFLYLLSLVIAINDIWFSFRWLSFSLWISSVLIILFFIFWKEIGSVKAIIKVISRKKELILLLWVIIAGILLNFLFLSYYPFVASGDEIRDGGWNARQILEGTIKNIFGYGRYESHGLVIPTLVIPFYLIFKNSVLSYRALTALLATLDILVVYLLSRKIIGRSGAFFSSLILAILPLHLYYARTEIVVMFSIFLTSIILWSFYFFFKNKNALSFIFLGLILGFSSGFHASVRTVVFISFFVALTYSSYLLIKEKNKLKTILKFIGLIIFFFVGFGPRLLFSSPDNFFHLRTAAILKKDGSGWMDARVSLVNLYKNRQVLATNYWRSFRGYINKPVFSHFREKIPILPKALSLFFVLGIINAFFLNRNFFLYKLIAVFAILIPLTNSAVTDCVNCDHRWGPALPVCALLSGLGIEAVAERLKKPKFLQKIFFGFLILYIFFQGYIFFAKEFASRGRNYQDYLSMHLVYLLQSLPKNKSVCLSVSPQNYQFFGLLHIEEQHDFFLPGLKIIKKANPGIPENVIYVTKDCNIYEKKVLLYNYCVKKDKFICPLNYNHNLEIYVERNLVY